ncbi:hypothetical protein ACQKWADRAFT_317735, partial [Trichoderma austrokoningii]
CSTPIANIQSSNDTNPFTASELRANIQHNNECAAQSNPIPPSDTTNPFTASEFEAILKQADPQLERESSSASATNPIPSTEFEAMVKRHEESSSRLGKSAANNEDEKATKPDNIIVNDDGGVKKQAGIQTPPCRQRIRRAVLKFNMNTVININAQALGMSGRHVPHSAGELALFQSQHDVGYSIQIAVCPADQRCARRTSRSKAISLDFIANNYQAATTL